MSEERFLNPADVAKEVGVAPATVKVWADSGGLSVAARTINGTRLFRRSDIEAFLRGRKKERVVR
jgi:DNA-binding transcriptional MerR regulator